MTAAVTWFGRSADNYVTKGGEVVRLDGGWFARAGTRARGPLRSLDDAMDACAEMIAAQRRRGEAPAA